jgi:L-arabinokinase
VSSSAAIEVATMINLMDHFGVRALTLDGPANSAAVHLAALCQQVENRVVGAPCGIMDQVTSCAGEAGSLLRLICQPHELQPPLKLPAGVRVVGINSNVKHSVGGGAYGRTRCAAFMAHRMILQSMRRAGATMGKELARDPMNGYLANLDPDDYKQHFRPRLPEFMKGSDFLRDFQSTIDTATTVQPEETYPVQHAADHHVLEARRVRNFVEYLEEADRQTDARKRRGALDRAGHLMYASHLSYTNDAMLGAEECDLLVKLVRDRESGGLYGAKITGGGSGGTVAVLADAGAKADAVLAEILAVYEKQTGRKPDFFTGTSPGAWRLGSSLA